MHDISTNICKGPTHRFILFMFSHFSISVIARSTIYFEEEESNTFIETGSYKTAAETFGKTKVLVLSGHPGEGKTTMAKTLLLKQFLPGRCINITEPSDWKYIDFSLNLIDGILIDDIFGSGVLDENLVKEWERKLNDLSRIGKEKGISIILTSRHYIIEETKQIVRTLPLFKKENIHILSSKDLTEEEKMQILKSHIKANSRKTNQEELLLCILRHSLILESSLFETDGFMFGFPQCVNLFTKQDDLFERGADFFGNPNSVFKTCIQELYRDQEKFLALIVLWANEGQHLSKSELDASHLSQHVKKVAIKFQGELEGKLIKNLRKSLDHHVGGLLHFSKEAGVYTFSHNVISDMVGLVIVEENPDDFLEFCTREFLLMYTTTNSTDDDLKFCIVEHLYKDLIKCFVDIMINNHSVKGLIECDTSLFELCRGGKMRNVVVPTFKYDFSVIKHDSFRNQKFVDCFLAFLTDNRHLETLFGQELMVMSGFFLKYGIHIDQQNYFLLSYAVYLKADVLAERIIVNNLLNKTELSKEEISIEYTLALLFAVHHQLHDAVKLLVETQASVSEEAIYIAAHRTDLDILKLLLGVKDRNSLKNMKILNGNNALIVAAKKGFSDAVKCLIDFGYSLDVRNNDGMSALDKAVAFKQESVCELLANAGASINIKTKKFNRTPLHTAADLGLQTAIKSLLTKGALVKMKDHKGFFPIHSAALNGHIDVVKLLIEHNPEQAGFRTKTYGEKSVLKGKTIFHIALYKKDYTLLEALLATKANPNVTDLYGRTPFFEAVSSGDAKAIQLLNSVAELNNHDKNGFTPLHVAVYNGYLEVVKLLCSNPSVNVNAQDKYGKTPLHLAALTGRYEIFLHLISYQADWRMITNRGDSLAHIAYRKARNTFRPFDQLTKIDLQCFLHCLLHVTGKSQQLKNLFKDLISAITTSNPGILQECIKDYNGTDRNTVDAQSDKTSLHQTVIDHGAETSEHLTDKCRESIHLIILICNV